VDLVWDNKIKTRCHILTEEKVNDIGARSKLLPKKNHGKMGPKADILISSARTTSKLIKLCPHKITQVLSL
jgi:hypothetical protein